MSTHHRSWVEIDATRLAANFRAIRRVAGPDAEALAVIKADAYGHNAELCAPVLARAGARWFGVADSNEGACVRAALNGAGFPSSEILIMSGSLPADQAALSTGSLTPVVWTPEHIHALSGAPHLKLQVEVDTGMGRQGAKPGAELAALLLALRHHGRTIDGLFTHLCSSEVPGSPHTALQKRRFEAAVQQVRESGLRPNWLHIANSSAVDHPSDTKPWIAALARSIGAKPMARTGLALYGHTLPTGIRDAIEPRQLVGTLQPVLTWKARILAVHTLSAGDTVGYGATFTATHPVRVALLPVGYADGLRRELSNPGTDSPNLSGGWATASTPEGLPQRCPILGRISMNVTVIDVSAAPNLAPGDPVTLLGEGITADDHARIAGTISYEILCALRHLPHIVVNGPA